MPMVRFMAQSGGGFAIKNIFSIACPFFVFFYAIFAVLKVHQLVDH
jgi:hypothetical protein